MKTFFNGNTLDTIKDQLTKALESFTDPRFSLEIQAIPEHDALRLVAYKNTPKLRAGKIEVGLVIPGPQLTDGSYMTALQTLVPMITKIIEPTLEVLELNRKLTPQEELVLKRVGIFPTDFVS